MSDLREDKTAAQNDSGRGLLPGSVVITDSCPCYTCGYDLRTHTVGHRCPECGTTIVSPEENRRIIRKQRNLPDTLLFRTAFVLFVGFGGAMLIMDQLAMGQSHRRLTTGIHTNSGADFVLLAWPLVHILTTLYLAVMPPSIGLLRTRGVLAGLTAQRMRLFAALALAAAYVISVVAALASLSP